MSRKIILTLILLVAAIQPKVHSASISVDELETQVVQLKSELKDLQTTVHSMQLKMESNIADQFADKTIQSVQLNNQKDATKFWMELLSHAEQTNSNQVDKLLTDIVMKTYDGKRSNFYPLLEFIIKNNVTQAYPKLYDTLLHYNHVFDGQEIFVFAKFLRETCGESTQLYNNLPLTVRQIVSGAILLRNRDNMGYVIGAQHTPCTSRQDCYGLPKTEAFVHRLSRSLTEEDVLKNPRSHWHFTIPITMDMKEGFNGTRMACGFHLKNVAEDKYLIAKLRMTTFFLRNDTNFDSYYKGEMQCQFKPMLIRGMDNSIKLALVEKYIPNTEFVYAANWGRKIDKMHLGRRKMNGDEADGFAWNIVVPPQNDREVDSSNENMLGEDSITSNTNIKCQF